MKNRRLPMAGHYLRAGAIVGTILTFASSTQAQTISFLGVPFGGGEGNIGQTDPSCTVNGGTITCPSGVVLVQYAIFIEGWDDGTGRRLGSTQVTVNIATLDNGAFQLVPLDFYDVSERENGAFMVLSTCVGGGTSDGLACGNPQYGPFGPGQPGVDEAECQADGGLFCADNPNWFMACCNGLAAVATGPASCTNPLDCAYSWAGTHQDPQGPVDFGEQRYVGDYVLEVPADASGLWTIEFLVNNDLTFMNDDQSGPIVVQALLPGILRISGDCNNNGVDDFQDIAAGTSNDCNGNGLPDDCEDCNGNGWADECDLANGTSNDCNDNDIPDVCDIVSGVSVDCNDNGIPDVCDISNEDCDNNGVIDSCDVASGGANDCDANGIPDLCDDCNSNGTPDEGDIFSGNSLDCNDNCVPDECDDCNNNGTADIDDIAAGTSADCNDNCVPDECEADCNTNGVPDDCDIADGTSTDADGNGVPDECLYPPAMPGAPYDALKNRYLSLALRNGSGVVAMSVTLPDGREAWIGEPAWVSDRGTNAQWVADLQTSPAGDGSDQMRDWSPYTDPTTGENVIHLRGCPIFPDQTYEIRVRAAALEPSDPALFSTTPRPTNGSWADTVGSFDQATSTWNPPNGTVNFQDLAAVLDQYQQKERSPVTWNDLGGALPNYLINSVDILAAIQGFQSRDFWDIVAGHDSIDDCVIPAP